MGAGKQRRMRRGTNGRSPFGCGEGMGRGFRTRGKGTQRHIAEEVEGVPQAREIKFGDFVCVELWSEYAKTYRGGGGGRAAGTQIKFGGRRVGDVVGWDDRGFSVSQRRC